MRKLYSSAALVSSLAVIGLALACQQAPPPAPQDTRAADELAVRDADAAFSKAAAAHDLEATVAFYADDASVLAANMPLLSGKDSIRKLWSEMLANSAITVSWQAGKVEASHGGDLVYIVGSYDEKSNDPKAKPDRGKFVEIWKKQPDGKWKVIVDAFNTDLPAPEAGKK